LVRRPEEKKPLGRLRHRREDNIKINIQEGGCLEFNGLLWTRTGRSDVAVVNAVKNLWVP